MQTITLDAFKNQYGDEAASVLTAAAPKTPSLSDRIAATAKGGISRAGDAIEGTGDFTGEGVLRRGTAAVRSVADIVPAAVNELLPESVRKAEGGAASVVGKGFKSVTDAIASVPGLSELILSHPKVTSAIEEALGTAENVGGIAGDILTAEGARGVGSQAGNAAKSAASAAADITTATGEEAVSAAQSLRQKVQSIVAREHVNPQLETSAKSIASGDGGMAAPANPLFLEGTTNVGDPLPIYDSYLSQSKKAIGDIRADPPIATVGEDIGSAFKSVVAQRRTVGKAMGSELKKIGTTPTDILPAVDDFVAELKDNGVTFDRLKREIVPTADTKLSASDIKLLESYATELQKLGSKPTITQLDAALSRIPDDIKVYKAANNLTGTTNGERIVKSSLAQLREQFNPATTGNLELAPYYEARKAYSSLSDFVNEGARYLGKITQTGDFAKDASLAKSAVQSILNNGKKDWLIKLETLTGHPLLDKAVLALQAMADAGDFRGLSLLQTLSEGGSIPLTKAGLSSKVLDFALKHGANAILGSSSDLTRRFLSDLAKTSPK